MATVIAAVHVICISTAYQRVEDPMADQIIHNERMKLKEKKR